MGWLIQNHWQKASRAWILLSVVLVSGASALRADRVYLRSGAQLDGGIVDQNKNEITFRLSSGLVQKIPKGDILRIVYGNLTPEQRAQEEKQKQDEIARIQAYQNQIAEAKRQEEAAQKAQNAKTLEQPVRPENKTANTGGPWGCVWRSALLPGWGQSACGQTRSALEVGVLFLGAGAYAAKQNALQQNALKRYNRESLYGFLALAQQGTAQTGIQYELVKQSKGQYHSRLRGYSQAMSILSFIYLAQIAHAYWIGRPANQAASAEPLGDAPALSLAQSRQTVPGEFLFRDRPIVLSFTTGF